MIKIPFKKSSEKNEAVSLINETVFYYLLFFDVSFGYCMFYLCMYWIKFKKQQKEPDLGHFFP